MFIGACSCSKNLLAQLLTLFPKSCQWHKQTSPLALVHASKQSAYLVSVCSSGKGADGSALVSPYLQSTRLLASFSPPASKAAQRLQQKAFDAAFDFSSRSTVEQNRWDTNLASKRKKGTARTFTDQHVDTRSPLNCGSRLIS
eukprot:1044195-Pelagomonas_calceolata.AAC.4